MLGKYYSGATSRRQALLHVPCQPSPLQPVRKCMWYCYSTRGPDTRNEKMGVKGGRHHSLPCGDDHGQVASTLYGVSWHLEVLALDLCSGFPWLLIVQVAVLVLVCPLLPVV